LIYAQKRYEDNKNKGIAYFSQLYNGKQLAINPELFAIFVQNTQFCSLKKAE